MFLNDLNTTSDYQVLHGTHISSVTGISLIFVCPGDLW